MRKFMLLNPNSLDGLFALLNKVCYSPKETELIVAAGDHGIAREGISRYMFGQTLSVLKVSASNRSPVSLICKKLGVNTSFLNIGCVEKRSHMSINDTFYAGAGTHHIAESEAMDKGTMLSILEAADDYVKKNPANQFCLGEVGIGNTLPSTAIVAIVTSIEVRELTGTGSGIQNNVFEKKITLIEQAIKRHRDCIGSMEPLSLLHSLGGFEIAWNVGIILAANKYNKIVLLDGFITGVAALIAYLYNKHVTKNIVATHLSREPGHKYLLEIIGIKPFLDLNMALGQGFGAALGFSFILNAADLLKKP